MSRGGQVVVELLRLAVVLAMTALGALLGPTVGELAGAEPENARLVGAVLGALTGYLLGGVGGRGVVRGVDVAQERLESTDSVSLVAAVLGASAAGLLSTIVLVPVWLLPAKAVTIPASLAVVLAAVYAGGRLGGARGPELARFVGVRGRLQVHSPSRGRGVKVVDSSALIDGRLVEVARAGFLEGTLVVPTFVLEEVQAQADVEEPRRRKAARRGLDALATLQDEGLVQVEVTEDRVAGVQDVDAELTRLCRMRQAALVTVDSNLARVGEIAGVRVLNLHQLAEAVRPPALPGDRLTLAVVREGREEGQGVGYLPDGTMVVVERAADAVGEEVEVEVTSILQTSQGRMLFSVRAEEGASTP